MTKHRVLLCLVVVVLAAPAYAGGGPVGTVPSDHWAYDAVKELVDAGVLIGYPDGTIRGNEFLTRYEFAMAISRLMDAIETTGVAGPRGRAGRQGAAGPAGPAGTQGPSSAGSPATVVAAAPAGATAAASAASGNWADRISIDGYLQMRYEDRDMGRSSGSRPADNGRDGEHDGFYLPRLHVSLRADVNERTKAVMTWSRLGDTSSRPQWTTDWTDIYLDYAASDKWTVRIGQAPNWFGLEGAQDSSQRVSLERAAFLTRIPELGGPDWKNGVYHAGRWDRGVWFIRNRKSTGGPQAILGLTNGSYRDVENNSNKALSVDLKWERPWGQYGVSWLDSKTSFSPDRDRSALLGYVRLARPDQRWAAQAEYMDGKLHGDDVAGWYGQLEYRLTKNPTWAFVKLEEFNPEGDAKYEALHLGLTKQLDENNELTLQWTDADCDYRRRGSDKTRNKDLIGLQWQMIFD